MEVPRLGAIQSCSCQPTPEPQQRGIPATSATYTTAHSNSRSLTHWARLGIKPATSWFLVGFVSACATMGTTSLYYCSSQIVTLTWLIVQKSLNDINIHKRDNNSTFIWINIYLNGDFIFLKTVSLFPKMTTLFIYLGHNHSMWKFPSQGSNPCQSSDPSHFSDKARSLTNCATREL